ncbi:MAG: CHAP domain-containing protein [Oscillospiraceae bacterium]|nr:CHAP domain-containing protein [Oscillospiraceae bacterium]
MKKLITALTIVTMILVLGISALAANSPVVFGDANGDGDVSNVDLIIIARFVVGLTNSIDLERADINGDGTVSNTDLISVARRIVYGRYQQEIILYAGDPVLDVGSDGLALMFAELSGSEDEVPVYNATTKVLVGTLYDNGRSKNGDETRHDGIYSGYITVDVSEVGDYLFYAAHNGYVRSQTVIISVKPPLTDADYIDIAKVDDKLCERVLNSENFVNLTKDERCSLANSVFKELISSGLVKSGSVDYDEETYTYTFTYKCSRRGTFVMGNPAGAYLKNGGMELGSDLFGWSQSGDTRMAYSIGGVIPVQGEGMAMLSAGAGKDLSSISQRITLPPDANRLSFYFNMYCDWPPEWSSDAFSVDIISSSETTTLLSKRACTSRWFAINPQSIYSPYHTGWEWREYDISGFAGQTIEIRFSMSGSTPEMIRVLLDEITVSDSAVYTCTADEAVTLALSQLGITEWPKDSNNVKYNTAYYGEEVYGSSTYPWCCAFIWWLFDQNNANSLFYGGYRTASCTTLMNYAKENGLWISGPNGFRVGDLVLYDFDGWRYDADHIGIFIGYDEDGCLLVVEGNTSTGNDANGGAVMLRIRDPEKVLGAYRPNYADTPTYYN